MLPNLIKFRNALTLEIQNYTGGEAYAEEEQQQNWTPKEQTFSARGNAAFILCKVLSKHKTTK